MGVRARLELTLAFALHPSLEPFLLAKDDLADALPPVMYIAICCQGRACRGCRCSRQIETLISEGGVKGKSLVDSVGKDGRMVKQSRYRASDLALQNRQ